MKHPACLSTIVAISFLLLCEPIVAAQTGAPQSRAVPVYLEDVHLKGKSRFDRDVELDNFAQKLLELRLAELGFYELRHGDIPECKKVETAGAAEASASPTPEPAQAAAGDKADYYVIRASIEVRAAQNRETEVALEYELLKYVQCESVSLIHYAQPFAEPEVLKYFNTMAEVVSTILEREHKAAKVSVEVATFTSPEPELQLIATNLANEVLSQLEKASEFEARDGRKVETSPAPDFTLGGQLLLGERLGFRLTIRSKAGRPFHKDIHEGPNRKGLNAENLTAFYKDMSDQVLAYLRQERSFTEQARRSLGNKAAALEQLQQVKKMCGDESANTGCVQPDEVVAKLVQIVESRRITAPEELFVVYHLLGTAQLQLKNFLAAAMSFEAAIGRQPKISKTEERVSLLNQAGAAWFQAKDYQKAVKRYGESLQLAASQPKIHLERAKSYRYGNERLEALKALLGSLRTLPQPQPELISELEYLMNDLREEEVGLARKFLDENKETLPVELAMPLLRGKA